MSKSEHMLRLVPTPDKTKITMILKINDYNDTHIVYILSTDVHTAKSLQ